MAKISKADCMTVDEAATSLGCSRATLYSYINVLGVQRHKFPLDRRSYVEKQEVERIREVMKENRD